MGVRESSNRYRFWIGADDLAEKRLQILVSKADAERIDAATARSVARKRKRVRVYDFINKKHIVVRSAPCGLDCYCALEIVRRKK